MEKILELLNIIVRLDCEFNSKIESNSLDINFPNFDELQNKLNLMLDELKSIDQIEKEKKIELLIQLRILIIQYLEFFEDAYEKITSIIVKK